MPKFHWNAGPSEHAWYRIDRENSAEDVRFLMDDCYSYMVKDTRENPGSNVELHERKDILLSPEDSYLFETKRWIWSQQYVAHPQYGVL